ncbi:hypothetical protein PIB30_094819 [Stylosanthes scabra]|uniref:Uncharacterized protein n=1 Tax=Stylosanthes scabra TaxID=79078 RepID=A0ABU6RVY6_9FABA|nr:hypothetical protein [Stylosanthes scabra]
MQPQPLNPTTNKNLSEQRCGYKVAAVPFPSSGDNGVVPGGQRHGDHGLTVAKLRLLPLIRVPPPCRAIDGGGKLGDGNNEQQPSSHSLSSSSSFSLRSHINVVSLSFSSLTGAGGDGNPFTGAITIFLPSLVFSSLMVIGFS